MYKSEHFSLSADGMMQKIPSAPVINVSLVVWPFTACSGPPYLLEELIFILIMIPNRQCLLVVGSRNRSSSCSTRDYHSSLAFSNWIQQNTVPKTIVQYPQKQRGETKQWVSASSITSSHRIEALTSNVLRSATWRCLPLSWRFCYF